MGYWFWCSDWSLDFEVVAPVAILWLFGSKGALVFADHRSFGVSPRASRSACVEASDVAKALVAGPRVFHVFVTSPLLLSLFGWHSCRRGGATHGYHNGVTLDLLAPHGGWFTQQGLKAYTSAAFEQRLSVTLRM